MKIVLLDKSIQVQLKLESYIVEDRTQMQDGCSCVYLFGPGLYTAMEILRFAGWVAREPLGLLQATTDERMRVVNVLETTSLKCERSIGLRGDPHQISGSLLLVSLLRWSWLGRR
jgi:hypothetical protein